MKDEEINEVASIAKGNVTASSTYSNVVSLMGCAIGILLSWVTIQIVNVVGGEDVQYAMSQGVVWLSIAFSILIGVIFGLYPANKAAKKKPIDALRYTG